MKLRLAWRLVPASVFVLAATAQVAPPATGAQSSPQAVADCTSPPGQLDPDSKITACTAVIKSSDPAALRPAIFNNRGIAYFQKDQFELAAADFTEALRLDPTLAQAAANRGHAFDRLNQPEKAIADFTEAIRLDSSLTEAFHSRAVEFAATGRLEEAIADFTQTITLGPADPVALANRGNAYRLTGRFDLAIADYANALLTDPRVSSLAGRGYSNLGAGDFVAAARDFAAVVTRTSIDPWSVLALHTAKLALGADDHATLEQNASRLDLKSWPGPLISFLLHSTDAASVLSSAQGPERTCEANYYMGEEALMRGDLASARSLLSNAASGCPATAQESSLAAVALKRAEARLAAPPPPANPVPVASPPPPPTPAATLPPAPQPAVVPTPAPAAPPTAPPSDRLRFAIESLLSGDSIPPGAKTKLASDTEGLSLDAWPGPVVRYFLGLVNAETLRRLAVAGPPDQARNCDVQYYLGLEALLRSNPSSAGTMLRQALDACPAENPLHEAASRALVRMATAVPSISTTPQTTPATALPPPAISQRPAVTAKDGPARIRLALDSYLVRARSGIEAKQQLIDDTKGLNLNLWPGPVVRYFLGESTITAVRRIAVAGTPEEGRVCDIRYYSGEQALLERDRALALTRLRTALAACPESNPLHAAATDEITRLSRSR